MQHRHARVRPPASPLFLPLLLAVIAVIAVIPAVAAASPAGHARVSEPTPVFVGGEGGYPVYRIPAATRLERGKHAGRILAFAEGRGTLADNGANDIVLRTSDDGGATWSALQVLCDLPGRSLNNPCVVEVRDGARAGRVHLMFQSYPEGCGEACVTEGYEPKGEKDTVCRTLVIHSDDGGATWSAPREVTRGVRRASGATSVASGPGVGIQLACGPHRGRIVMPFNEGPYDRWRVYAAFSDDGGDTWRFGDVAPNPPKGLGNEVQMFERADGSVVLNARQHLGAKRRTSAVSSDGGATWSPLADVPELPDPQCMGGVLALGARVVVFTGCDSETRRARGTMWISRDDGASWSEKVLVEPEGFAYSVPVALGGGDVGVLYEGGGYRSIVFRRTSLPPAPVR